jgi:hypothetical protein
LELVQGVPEIIKRRTKKKMGINGASQRMLTVDLLDIGYGGPP